MSSVLFNIEDSVAFISFNRPEKYNAFNFDMAKTFQQRLDDCKDDKNIRCVYITGIGKAFSAGQDLEEVIKPDGLTVVNIVDEYYNPIISRIRYLEKPVVAAINGVAAGAGANIALCCDITLATESASFIQGFSKIGLVPDSGGSFFLPRLVGLQKALALAMLSDKVSASEAERMGMVYKVFKDEEFQENAIAIAKRLAMMPTKALAYTKKAFNQCFISSLEEQLHTEEILQQRASATEDFKEGIKAFLEKRTPNFKGE